MWKSTKFKRYLECDCLSPSLVGWSQRAYLCSFKEAIPLCFTPNGLGGSRLGPIFLRRNAELSKLSYLLGVLTENTRLHSMGGAIRR
jgi:hypothetical protein